MISRVRGFGGERDQVSALELASAVDLCILGITQKNYASLSIQKHIYASRKARSSGSGVRSCRLRSDLNAGLTKVSV